jgi:hypothetical protein
MHEYLYMNDIVIQLTSSFDVVKGVEIIATNARIHELER